MTDLVKVDPQPRPDRATLAAVRRTLGTKNGVDRLDLLEEYLDRDTAALVVLWLGGTRRASPATRQAYADDILAWADWARRELDLAPFALNLMRHDVTMWVTQQQDAGAANSSIARRLSSLSSLYRYAAGWGLPVRSPISEDDHRPKYERGRKATSARVLDALEVAGMLAASKDTRDALVLGILFTDAVRVSELCSANRDDVDDDGTAGCWLRVTRKGGKQVRVALDLVVCQLLAAYNDERPSYLGDGPEPLVVDEAGLRLDRHDVTRMLRRLARAAGVPRPNSVTPHSMRASAITDQIKRGVDVRHVQEKSGHADLRTLMIYVEEHGKSDRDRQMTADLGRVMGSVPDQLRTADQ